jgi:hypothetical protein
MHLLSILRMEFSERRSKEPSPGSELAPRGPALVDLIGGQVQVMFASMSSSHWLAYWNVFGRPATKPRYARGIPETWRYDRDKAAKVDQ